MLPPGTLGGDTPVIQIDEKLFEKYLENWEK